MNMSESLKLSMVFEYTRFIYEVSPWLSDPEIRQNFNLSTGWNRIRYSDITTRKEHESYVPAIQLTHDGKTLYCMYCFTHFPYKEAASLFADKVVRLAAPILFARLGVQMVKAFAMEDFN